MNRLHIIPLWVHFFCFLYLPVGESFSADSLAEHGTVRGQVVSLAGGVPVENAQVVLDRRPPDGTPEFRTESDLFGFFTLKDVTPGEYSLEVEHTAFFPGQTNLTLTAGASTNQQIKLAPIDGKVVFDIYFQVWCLATHANLSGTTVNVEYWAPGSNLAGAPDQRLQLQTGVGGSVTAKGVEDGFYRFIVSRPGWEPLFYEPRPDAGLVVVGDKVRLIRTHFASAFLQPIRKELKVVVKGHDPVKDQPDLPLQGMVLKLTGVSPDDPDEVLVPTISALSREDGSYIFTDLPPINWKVVVGKLGYKTKEVLVSANPFGALPETEIAVELEDVRVKAKLSSPYKTPKAVTGARVRLHGIRNSNTEGIQRELLTETDEGANTASVTFEKLLPGRYWMQVIHQATIDNLPSRSGPLPSPTSFRVSFFPRETYAEVSLPENAEQEQVEAMDGSTSAVEEVELELQPVPAIIRGRVWATDELAKLDTEVGNPEPNRIFYLKPQSGIGFLEHKLVNLLAETNQLITVDTDEGGNYTALVIPGIFGVQIPSMNGYTGHNIEFGDVTAGSGPRVGPWPYPEVWPYNTYEGGHHGAGLRFDSRHEYQLDLFVHRQYINVCGNIRLESSPFGDLILRMDEEGGNQVTIPYNHLYDTGAEVTTEGTAVHRALVKKRYDFLLRNLQPGTYTITLNHPGYTATPTTITIAPWQPPGIVPAVAPFSPTYFFPGITHFDARFEVKVNWTTKGQIDIDKYTWVADPDLPFYSGPSSYKPTFFRVHGLPERLFRYNSISDDIPAGNYSIWRHFFGAGWYTGVGSGSATFSAYQNGPRDNIRSSDSPDAPQSYTMELNAYSLADRKIKIPNITVFFSDGSSMMANGSVPNSDFRGSTTVSRTEDPAGRWNFFSSEVELVDPDIRHVRVNVLMRRNMVVSGRIVDAKTNGIPTAAVVLRSSSGTPIAQQLTGADGSFRFTSVQPQSVYVDVNRRGYKPQRERFDPGSAENPDITNKQIQLEEVPRPNIDAKSFTMNRFGLFLPGVLKTSGPNPLSPQEARAKLTATWKVDAVGTNYSVKLPGFFTPAGEQGPDEEFEVVDRVSEVWIVDRRAFEKPFVNEENQKAVAAVDPPNPMNYLAVSRWLGEINAGQKDGLPYYVVHQLVKRERVGSPSQPGLNSFKGEIRLWELPSGVFKPRILAITEHGGVAIADYELPPAPAPGGPIIKYVPLQGINMPPWMAGLTEFIAAGATLGKFGRDEEKIHSKYGEGFMKIDPNLNFTATIALSPLDSNPQDDATLLYKYALGVELSVGANTSESGPLAVGPKFLGTKLTGITVEMEVAGGEQDASIALSGDGPEKEIPLNKLTRFLPAAASRLPVALGSDGKCPEVLVCILPPNFKASAKIGGSEKLDADWLGNNVISAYSFILEGAGMFENFQVKVKLDPVIQKLPYIGPILGILEKFNVRVGMDGKFKSTLGAKLTYKHITHLPKSEGTRVRGEQGERWDFMGTPSGDSVRVPNNPTPPSEDDLELNIIVKVAAGLGIVAKLGSSSDGPAIEGTGWVQLGAPKQSNNPEGMYFQIDPTLGSPLVQKVSGAFSLVGEISAKVWVISWSKSWQVDIARWDKDFRSAVAAPQGIGPLDLHTTLPYMELTPVYITTTVINPLSAPASAFVGRGGTLVREAYQPGALSLSPGEQPRFAFISVDPATGESALMVSSINGTEWNAPEKVASAAGIISVGLAELPSGRGLAIWSEIAAGDLANPYASSTLKYAVSSEGGGWSSPAVLLESAATIFSLQVTRAGEAAILTFLSTTEGPLGENRSLHSAEYENGQWSPIRDLLVSQPIGKTEIAGSETGQAFLLAETENRLLLWNREDGWGAPGPFSEFVEGAISATFGPSDNGAVAWQGPGGAIMFASRAPGSMEWSQPLQLLSEIAASELELVPVKNGEQDLYLLAWTAGADVNSVYYAMINTRGEFVVLPTEATIASGGIYQKLQLRPLAGPRAAVVAQLNSGGSSTIHEFVIGLPAPGDCNGNGIADATEIANQALADCNRNGVPDLCEIRLDTALDRDSNGILDECETPAAEDCNRNGIPDEFEMGFGLSDLNKNGVLDDCEGRVRVLTVPLDPNAPVRFYRATNLRIQSRTGNSLELEFEGNLEQANDVSGPWDAVE